MPTSPSPVPPATSCCGTFASMELFAMNYDDHCLTPGRCLGIAVVAHWDGFPCCLMESLAMNHRHEENDGRSACLRIVNAVRRAYKQDTVLPRGFILGWDEVLTNLERINYFSFPGFCYAQLIYYIRNEMTRFK